MPAPESDRPEAETVSCPTVKRTVRAALFSKKHMKEEYLIFYFLWRKVGLFAEACCVFFLCFPPAADAALASWYSVECCENNSTSDCKTASGRSLYELEREKIDFAAAWQYPMGQKLEIVNDSNGRTVTVTVLDRGPNKRLGRAIDLSRSAFQKISNLKEGVIRVSVRVLP